MLLGMPIVREMYVFTAIEHPKRLGHNVWLGLGILVIEWSFIFKFGHGEIAKAGVERGVDPFASNPWWYAWALSLCFLFGFSILHFSPPCVRNNVFDYTAASDNARKAVDVLLICSMLVPSVLGVQELYSTVGYCDPLADPPVWDGCSDGT